MSMPLAELRARNDFMKAAIAADDSLDFSNPIRPPRR
jgi:hypothetical protein